MMAVEQFEVFPLEDGKWIWQHRVGGDVVESGKPVSSRADAYAGAQEARGDVVTPLLHMNGSPAGEARTRGPQRIVLLRKDGSLYGELDHELKAGGPAQHVSIVPASDHGEAVEIGG